MFENKQGSDIRENYNIMLQVAEQMLADEQDICANLANLSALINNYMDKLNWVGFYLMKDGELVLGPFQGKPACVRIQVGRGVCGTTAAQHKITVVDNVHEFEGHIACDSASNSEIVLPIYRRGEIYGVLDVDSPEFARFGTLEQEVLAKIATLLSNFLDKA